MCLLVGGLVTYVHPGPHFMAIFNEAHYYYDDKKREKGGGTESGFTSTGCSIRLGRRHLSIVIDGPLLAAATWICVDCCATHCQGSH